MKKKETVFVGLSGGVDSAVTAMLLKREGYLVVGVFIRTWHPDFLNCSEEAERMDAMRVSAHLDIPFLTFDFANEYKKEVADYMISEYREGRTPNPDVMCNKEIKFGAFLKKSMKLGADYIATGHYAMVLKDPDSSLKKIQPMNTLKRNADFEKKLEKEKKSSKIFLAKGIDPSKDQSYFLWTLEEKQLAKVLFPVGGFYKSEIRLLAEKYKLPVFKKKDSQGICFLGDVNLKDFLAHYIKEKKGIVKNTSGKTIGWHKGIAFYTLGERKGFIITKKSPKDKSYFVIEKDKKKNILVVSTEKKSDQNVINLYKTNWISETPLKNKKYTVHTRYHGEDLACTVLIQKNKKARVILEKPVLVAKGQSCVIYDKNICLGGGIVI